MAPEAAAAASGPRPIVEFLKIPGNGSAPYLEGQKCRQVQRDLSRRAR